MQNWGKLTSDADLYSRKAIDSITSRTMIHVVVVRITALTSSRAIYVISNTNGQYVYIFVRRYVYPVVFSSQLVICAWKLQLWSRNCGGAITPAGTSAYAAAESIRSRTLCLARIYGSGMNFHSTKNTYVCQEIQRSVALGLSPLSRATGLFSDR